jgi:hypothetical protein
MKKNKNCIIISKTKGDNHKRTKRKTSCRLKEQQRQEKNIKGTPVSTVEKEEKKTETMELIVGEKRVALCKMQYSKARRKKQ